MTTITAAMGSPGFQRAFWAERTWRENHGSPHYTMTEFARTWIDPGQAFRLNTMRAANHPRNRT